MRTRLFASLLLAGAGLLTLGGCHDGYSTVGYSYSYGSYAPSCDYGPSYVYPSYSYGFHYDGGHHGHYQHHHHHGHHGHHGGGHDHY